jgi:DNA-binding transcriptional MerR regulator/effector-binding domain-containing protein
MRIGDLARLGGVSVRMLRHYHEIGLLTPEHVDETTGYRSYRAGQLELLRRIVTLKDLGLSLAEVDQIVHGKGTTEQVRQLLTTRRSQIVTEIATATANLSRIDRQLLTLAGDSDPLAEPVVLDVVVKAVGSRLVAQLSAVAESWAPDDIGPVIQPLYPELRARLAKAGVAIVGPSTAWYEDTDEGRITVHATFGIDGRPGEGRKPHQFEVVDLPALARVASTVHRGTTSDIDATYQALLAWIWANGCRPLGYGREVDLACGPGDRWVAEIQIAIEDNPEEAP